MEVIGTIATIAALIFGVYQYVKSRARLEISARVRPLEQPGGPPVSRAECTCTVVNSGGKTISLSEIWVDQFRAENSLGNKPTRREPEDVSLPLRLDPGECREWRFNFPKGCELRCGARDVSGRVYRCIVESKVTS